MWLLEQEAPPQARGRVFARLGAWDRGATMGGELMGGALATYGSVIGGIRWSAVLTLGLLLPIGLLGRAQKINTYNKEI